MGEKTLRWNLLRYNFESQIQDTIEIQRLISHNIHNLLRGSRETREDFRYLQQFFSRTLQVSIAEVRECMDLVSIDELDGFDVIPITRLDDDDCEEIDDENEENDTAKSEQEAIEIMKGDPSNEEIMAYMGTLTVEELVAFCNRSAPPDDVEQERRAQPKDTNQNYDDNGFYIEEVGEESSNKTEYENGAPLVRMEPRIQSWADEVEDAVQDGTLLAPNTPSPSPSRSSSGSDLQSHRKPKPRRLPPISQELSALLECLHANPNVKRTRFSGPLRLRDNEMERAQIAWNAKVNSMKRREGVRSGGRGPRESWEEADLLDGWDLCNGQYYWQTEGLFLCRLTQAVYKDRFVGARDIYRSLNISMKQSKKRTSRSRKAKKSRSQT